MKCVSGEDDYNAQKNFVDALCSVARDLNIHIHLVHHIRKLSSEAQLPDKTDVKGSGSITDQVDNLLMVWRNKAKELQPLIAMISASVTAREKSTMTWS